MSDKSAEARHLVERYVAASVHGDTSQLPDIIAPEFGSFPGHGKGPESVAKAIGVLRAAFSEVTCELELSVVEGEWVAFRANVSGTHSGPFAGRAPTGRRVRFTVADFVRIRDGKIAEVRSLQDNLPLFEALGAVARVRENGHH